MTMPTHPDIIKVDVSPSPSLIRVVIEGPQGPQGESTAEAEAYAIAAAASAGDATAAAEEAAASVTAATEAAAEVETLKDDVIALGEAAGSYTTLSLATAALGSISEGHGVYVTADGANNGFYFKRSGVLVRESTATLPALDSGQRKIAGGLQWFLAADIPLSATLIPTAVNEFYEVVSWVDLGNPDYSIDGAYSRATTAKNATDVVTAAVWAAEIPDDVAIPSRVTPGGSIITSTRLDGVDVAANAKVATDLLTDGLWAADLAEGSVVPSAVAADGSIIVAAASPLAGDVGDTLNGAESAGQSNGAGQTGAAPVSDVTNPDSAHVLMFKTAFNEVRCGMDVTNEGNPDLDPATITGFSPIRSALAVTGVHGTTAIEGFASARAQRERAAWGGKTSLSLAMVTAQSGKSIGELLEGGASTSWDNRVTMLTRAKELCAQYGRRYVHRLMIMDQSESNTATANLGDLHDQLRGEVEDWCAANLDQIEPVIMLASQMSSFFTSTGGVGLLGILARHMTTMASGGNYFCLGPTYDLPFSSDFLHHTSDGHLWRGERAELAYNQIERCGYWEPLYIRSAVRLSSTVIELAYDEPVALDTTMVAARTNAGLAINSATIDTVTAVNGRVRIATTGDNAGVTTISTGLSGHSGDRMETTIPRTNIRDARCLGVSRVGGFKHYRWHCHQQIALGS